MHVPATPFAVQAGGPLELLELDELLELLELLELELLDDPVPPPVTDSETREGRPVPDPQKPKLVLPPGAMTAS